MNIGLIGLGKMGNNMRARLKKAGIDVVGYDTNPAVSDVPDLPALAAALPVPRIVWVMVPAGAITDSVITNLSEVLEEGDLIIDGGNSKFTEDFKHSEFLAPKGIQFMDAGVSGGVWGLGNGYGLMVGGTAENVERA
ncbi:MAG: NAD(P)-binding domain-containing protein, partial [Herbiconiux sp.]|nr:NAD(P)-binding domain-containing protein [Herbiconiux sp.]